MKGSNVGRKSSGNIADWKEQKQNETNLKKQTEIWKTLVTKKKCKLSNKL